MSTEKSFGVVKGRIRVTVRKPVGIHWPWLYRMTAPFRKGFIQYTTFRRWVKAALCHYILSSEENYLVFGGWEKALFLKPDKGGDGSYHKKMVFKGDGKYETKYEGSRSRTTVRGGPYMYGGSSNFWQKTEAPAVTEGDTTVIDSTIEVDAATAIKLSKPFRGNPASDGKEKEEIQKFMEEFTEMEGHSFSFLTHYDNTGTDSSTPAQ